MKPLRTHLGAGAQWRGYGILSSSRDPTIHPVRCRPPSIASHSIAHGSLLGPGVLVPARSTCPARSARYVVCQQWERWERWVPGGAGRRCWESTETNGRPKTGRGTSYTLNRIHLTGVGTSVLAQLASEVTTVVLLPASQRW